MYFGAMSKDYGIIPPLEHHTCMRNEVQLGGQDFNHVQVKNDAADQPEPQADNGSADDHAAHVEAADQMEAHADQHDTDVNTQPVVANDVEDEIHDDDVAAQLMHQTKEVNVMELAMPTLVWMPTMLLTILISQCTGG